MEGKFKFRCHYIIYFPSGISGGSEAILHSVNRVLSQRHCDGSLTMLIVDFSNAFNMVDRMALLREVRGICPSIYVEYLSVGFILLKQILARC
jgi:hypothetical protein